ncbi:hypothetical protein DYB28_006093 [Aphanomyces astaci]|uniref:Uncharacterized protein n=1 Tax=Aphanomyces astaci TaxID=112090 RepID=A0A9X8DJR9_APHAT|nr:hypothetical protein DYB28_006093 [Aphanomyces astaci]
MYTRESRNMRQSVDTAIVHRQFQWSPYLPTRDMMTAKMSESTAVVIESTMGHSLTQTDDMDGMAVELNPWNTLLRNRKAMICLISCF